MGAWPAVPFQVPGATTLGIVFATQSARAASPRSASDVTLQVLVVADVSIDAQTSRAQQPAQTASLVPSAVAVPANSSVTARVQSLGCRAMQALLPWSGGKWNGRHHSMGPECRSRSTGEAPHLGRDRLAL